MKKPMLAVLAVCCVAGAVPGGEAPADQVVARVNGQPVMLSELTRSLLALHGREALEKLIYREVLKQAMKQAGFQPSPEDLALALEEERRNVQRAYGPDATLADMARRELGMTEEEYVREVLALRLFMHAAIAGKGEVPDGELRVYWANNQGRYQEPPRVRLSHVFIRAVDASGKGDWSRALKAAEEVYAKAIGGADFAELARRHSVDKKSAANGGDLGFVSPETFEWGPALLEVAYGLQVGNVAGPIQSMWGYHVIKLTQKIPGTNPDFDRVRNLVLADYLNEKVQVEADFFARRLVEKAQIERFLDDILSGKVGSTAPAGGTAPKPAGPGGFRVKE